MLINSMSSYPDKIDDMTFFQDCDLENIHIMNTYQDLLAKGQYREANRYMSRQEGLCGFFADYLNALENRIYHLQEYLLQKPAKKQPFTHYEEEALFSADKLQVFTDMDEKEDFLSISLFSDNDSPEPFDTLYAFAEEANEAEPPNATENTIWI